ncbi:MAG: hypothetical protein KatS3mg082_1537 [Nitrospiraceae bacterium]|nr:MAG: hypothetical protein KatS3mg082_1537 [Nitrospiraceae bacterium]
MIDRELITRKITLILKDLSALTDLSRLSREAYLANPINEVLAERYLERMIGRMIDINYHLITESGNPPPRDYHESFQMLVTMGILKTEFARHIACSAGLRNRIVHDYEEIDALKVYDALQEAIRQFPVYLDTSTGSSRNCRVHDWLGGWKGKRHVPAHDCCRAERPARPATQASPAEQIRNALRHTPRIVSGRRAIPGCGRGALSRAREHRERELARL